MLGLAAAGLIALLWTCRRGAEAPARPTGAPTAAPAAAPAARPARPAAAPSQVAAEGSAGASRPSSFDDLPPFVHPDSRNQPPPAPGTTEIKAVEAPPRRKLTEEEKLPARQRAVELLDARVARLEERLEAARRGEDAAEVSRLEVELARTRSTLALRRQELAGQPGGAAPR